MERGQEANFALAGTDDPAGPKRFRYHCAAADSRAGFIRFRAKVEAGPAEGGECVTLSGEVDLWDGGKAEPIAYARDGDAAYTLYARSRSVAATHAGGGGT